MLRRLLVAISGALAIPSFIAQGRDNGNNECRFEMEKSTAIFAGTYVFQQVQRLRFDFVITAKGKCPEPPLVFLRSQTSGLSVTGSMTTDADTIRLSGELFQSSEIGNELILVVPSTDECDFEIQQHSAVHFQRPTCQTGDQLTIGFEFPTIEDQTDFVSQDFVDLFAEPHDPKEIPDSVSGLLLVDAIRNYARYDYKRQWDTMAKEERTTLQESVYRHIRGINLKIQPLVTGDLAQKEEAEATARAACAYLNSLIANPKQLLDYKTITLSSFSGNWKRFVYDPVSKFPDMVIHRKESGLGQCQVSSMRSGRFTIMLFMITKGNGRTFYLRIQPFKTGDLTHRPQVEATVQAVSNLRFPNTQKIDYKTMRLSSFYRETYTPASRKRLRNKE